MPRKRRYRRRPYRRMRMRMRRRRLRRASRPEVKVYSSVLSGMPLYHYCPTALNRTSSDRDGLLQNIFNGIGLGTNYEQRLGNKIYVKFMRVTHACYLDSFTVGTTVYSPNSVGVRIMWTNDTTAPASPTAAGSANTEFYAHNSTSKFIQPINRRKYLVFYDKRKIITSGWPASPSDVGGQVATWSYRIRVNKTIVYNDTLSTSGQAKEDSMNYNLKAICYIPGYNNAAFQSASTSPVAGLSPMVLDTVIRTYYTDV